MNDTVSHLDYNESKVIVDGRETEADGGGLCQVTSTLYNAVNEAGLDVIERNPHYAQLPYIRPGLDATVWFGDEYGNGALDMRFENTSRGYVLLREYVADDGYVYAEVWGRPSGTEVRTWSEPVYRGRDSARWVTYQTYKKDGEVLFDGVLHRDTYEALTDEKGKPIPADSVPIAPVDP
ncbi:MAG: VanW family protein, partial [Actinomycetota bacterium]|nr:VanW family protein [Actinomycetota bacterium]